MIQCRIYNSPYVLRELWNAIYIRGNYTPFQAWMCNWWYYVVYHLKGSRFKYQPKFLVLNEEENICIVPVAVDKKHKNIIDFSYGGPIDYYDVISSSIDIEFVIKCVEYIKKMYEGYNIILNNINQDSLLFNALQTSTLIKEEYCVKIDFLSSSYEDYYQTLSKHQRQNIRTGYNKLHRDGLKWRVVRYDTNNPMPTADWNQCLKMYEERCRIKNKRGSGFKQCIVDWKNRQINLINILVHRWDRVTSFVMYLNDIPVAYMSGMYNESRDTFYVPRLSCSNHYLRYDAGILMLNESIKILLEEGVRHVDLTRGDEQYKFAMGGLASSNYTFKL